MLDQSIFKKLLEQGLISENSFRKIEAASNSNTVSLHWELKTMLYLGVLMLSTGLGILIYKNIDSIGHTAILAFIAIISLACFAYCFKHKMPYANTQVASPGIFFDYALLLGCLTFISFLAYLQYQYHVFGNRYGLASFIPLCLLFFSAYYFDHLGVLSLGITNFAAWLGITITPIRILEQNDFNNTRIIWSGLLIGVLLLVAAFASKSKKVKAHFEFTYANFGTHILFISAIAALIQFDQAILLVLLAFIGLVLFFYFKAFRERSFYFLVVAILYGYIGLSYAVVQLLSWNYNIGLGPIYIMLIYFIFSGIALVRFLMYLNKKLKADDSIQ